MQTKLNFKPTYLHSLEINFLKKNEKPGYDVVEYVDTNPLSRRKKIRFLCKPSRYLRSIHEILKSEIGFLNTRDNLPFAFQWIKGVSNPTVSSVLYHKRDKKFFSRYWFVTDLKSAYHSVDMMKLAIILEMKCLEEKNKTLQWFEILATYCVDPNLTLAEGLPVSPWLFNIYAGYELDRWLSFIAKEYSATYTRLGDDLIFSSPLPFGEKKRKRILDFIRGKGFEISIKKTRTFDLTMLGSFAVNGVGVRNTQSGGEVFLPRNYRKKIKGILHVALYGKDRNILDFPQISGMMGVFMSLISVSGFSKEDEKIIGMYKEFKRRYYNWSE